MPRDPTIWFACLQWRRGYWKFELWRRRQANQLLETGVYLAGPMDGVTDVIRLTDEECVGEFLLKLGLSTACDRTQLDRDAARNISIQVRGGSGRVHC